MTDTTEEADDIPRRAGSKGLIISGFLALLGAGVGFGLTYFGAIPSLSKAEAAAPLPPVDLSSLTPYSMVEMPVITLTLSGADSLRTLRLATTLEIHPEAEDVVDKLTPRVLDIFNGYLRAMRADDLMQPFAMTTIRTHLLHRAKIVAGTETVNDILITEFVVN